MPAAEHTWAGAPLQQGYYQCWNKFRRQTAAPALRGRACSGRRACGGQGCSKYCGGSLGARAPRGESVFLSKCPNRRPKGNPHATSAPQQRGLSICGLSRLHAHSASSAAASWLQLKSVRSDRPPPNGGSAGSGGVRQHAAWCEEAAGGEDGQETAGSQEPRCSSSRRHQGLHQQQ